MNDYDAHTMEAEEQHAHDRAVELDDQSREAAMPPDYMDPPEPTPVDNAPQSAPDIRSWQEDGAMERGTRVEDAAGRVGTLEGVSDRLGRHLVTWDGDAKASLANVNDITPTPVKVSRA